MQRNTARDNVAATTVNTVELHISSESSCDGYRVLVQEYSWLRLSIDDAIGFESSEYFFNR